MNMNRQSNLMNRTDSQPNSVITSNRASENQQNFYFNQQEQNEGQFQQTNNPSVRQSSASFNINNNRGLGNKSLRQSELQQQQDAFYQRFQGDTRESGLQQKPTSVRTSHLQQQQQQFGGYNPQQQQGQIELNQDQNQFGENHFEQQNQQYQESQTHILQNNAAGYINQTEEYIFPQNSLVNYLRHLYTLLLVQTLLILLGVWVAYIVPDILTFIVDYEIIIWISLATVVIITVSCFIFRTGFSQIPVNYIALFLQTLGLIVIYIYILDLYQVELAFLILIALSSIYLSLLCYVLTTKTELNFRGSTLFVTCSAIMVYQLFLIFTDLSYLSSIFILMGIIIWGYFLVYEYQTKISDVELENRDPIVSTITVFLDIFNLLLKVSELIRQVLIKERS